jgi:hypothetical protein
MDVPVRPPDEETPHPGRQEEFRSPYMEALTRLVTESLVRHGFDRPLDYRRLHWSHWFRCESVHSLLFVPSKPGVFALAEEISPTNIASDAFVRRSHVETAGQRSAVASCQATPATITDREGYDFSRADNAAHNSPASAAEGIYAGEESLEAPPSRRMLAVSQFFEDDDMAFVLDRMLSRENPMRARLLSGRYFVRFVVIEDESQRRSICNALNQWMANSAEKVTGIGPHFATSLELTPATEYFPQANEGQQILFPDLTANKEGHENREGHDFSRAGRCTPNAPALAAEGTAGATTLPSRAEKSPITSASPHLDSGAASNLHCPSPLPSGF